MSPRDRLYLLALVTACASDDGEENVITAGAETSATAADDDAGTGGMVELPSTFRLECIKVQTLGDGDGSVFQAQLLNNTWNDDIDDFRLNVLVTVEKRDHGGGTATFDIAAGFATSAEDQCVQAGTSLAMVAGTYDPQLRQHGSDSESCSKPLDAEAEPAGGTYALALGPEDVAYVYSEENDHTALNCTADPDVPDAVPLRALEASFTANTAGTGYHGVLTGCLLESEGLQLCSCLSNCTGDGPDDLEVDGDCAGCPTGGIPLVQLLEGINPSTRCTDIMGEPAYDIEMTFSGKVLPAQPTACM